MAEMYGITDIGLRRKNNEDNFSYGCKIILVPDEENQTREIPISWCAVCDGMGGYEGGEIASRIAVDHFSKSVDCFIDEKMKLRYLKSFLWSVIATANEIIIEKAKKDPVLNGMGSTVVFYIEMDDQALIANIGDSRAYLMRDGKIEPLTKDDSFVQNCIDSGELTPEEAKASPYKNVITKSLGSETCMSEDYISFKWVDIKKDDIVMLCSDGLSNCVDDSAILQIFDDCKNIESAVKTCIAEAKNNGGNDNITAFAIKY